MSISVIIPCYNEASRAGVSFEDRLITIDNYMSSNFTDYEIILVSDGSTDRTSYVIECFRNYVGNHIVSIVYKKNHGKGFAIKEGTMVSTKDFAFIMDADLSTNIDYIKYFYDIISADDNLDSVIGIRGFKYNTGFRHIVSKLSYFCMKRILGLDIKDTQCGFKIIRGNLLRSFSSKYQKCNNWLFDSELLVFLKENKYNIRCEYIDWTNNQDSRVKILSGVILSVIELLKIVILRYKYSE